MIKIFNKLKLSRLRKKRDELLKMSHKYSTIDRKKSDKYYSDAQEIINKITQITEDTNGNGKSS